MNDAGWGPQAFYADGGTCRPSSSRRRLRPWGLARRIAGRCPEWHWHRRRDTGELIRVYCDRGRHDLGAHAWGSDVWLAPGQRAPL